MLRQAASGIAVALDQKQQGHSVSGKDDFEHWGGQTMKVHNAFSGDKGATLNASSRVHTPQRRSTSIGSQRKSWLPPANEGQGHDRREVVAQRFLRMDEAHDRIRTKLLAASR